MTGENEIRVPLFPELDSSENFQEKARRIVQRYFNSREMAESNPRLPADYIMQLEDVYVVWFAKTLQNWKALVSTKVQDGMYYEVTYDGFRQETYLDAYRKTENVVYPDYIP